jgi:hypothetical protein
MLGGTFCLRNRIREEGREEVVKYKRFRGKKTEKGGSVGE